MPPWTGPARLLVGLAQGLLLALLYHAASAQLWPATQAIWFRPLLLAALFVPPVMVSGMTAMRPRRLLGQALILILLLAALGAYSAWRGDLGTLLNGPALQAWQDARRQPWDGLWPLLCAAAVAVFIAQALLLAAQADGNNRYLASYPRYFEQAWKLAVQIAFATLFMLLLWLILHLGAALFSLIGLHFPDKLLSQASFVIPVLAAAFSCALHLTDVRPGIIAGIRKLLLTVLAWLLPLAALIVAAFLVSLAFTGPEPLWRTRLATPVLLGATALLVVLISAVHEDGVVSTLRQHRVMAVSLWCACLLPLPLVALAVYALGLRVAQHGWTVDRISLALVIAVAALYAVGYAVAALRDRRHLAPIAPVNIAASLMLLVIFLAVHSPVADPARLAVADQLARLKAGKTDAAGFDYDFLRFDGARFGVRALHGLAQDDGLPATAHTQAQLTLRKSSRWNMANRVRPDIAANIRMHPSGQTLPAGFAAVDWKKQSAYATPLCLLRPGTACDGYRVPVPGQAAQLLLFDADDTPSLFALGEDGQWQMQGVLRMAPACRAQMKQSAAAGTLAWLPSQRRDVVINGQRMQLEPSQGGLQSCGLSAADTP